MEMEEYGMEEMDPYGMEEMDMEDGQMMDEMDPYGDEEEESFNFEDRPEYAHMPPLDRMRKIRRAIILTINEMRAAH